MKRFICTLVAATAVVALLSGGALAGCGSCGGGEGHSHDAEAKTASAEMGKCCIAAAQAGKGCCGKDAETVKASYAAYQAGQTKACSATAKAACAANKAACSANKAACSADKAACAAATQAAMADMHKCCATAVEAGKGCCGKDADALKADYNKKVAYHAAAASVQADMHECCATAMAEGKGCCGKDADALKADYDKKVQKAAEKTEKEMASL